MPVYRNGNSYSDQPGSGEDITDQLQRLLPHKRGKGRLGDPPSRSALPQVRAVVFPQASSAAGVQSPLIEDETQRTYWADQNLESSDGLFVVIYKPFKSRVFVDSRGTAIEFDYPDPAA